LRNHHLLSAAYREALADVGACHCYNVHPSMPALQEQMRVVPPEQAPVFTVRWMLHPARRYAEAKTRYQPFNRIVDDDPHTRQVIATMCRTALAAGRPTFVIANNKAEGSAPCTVTRLAQGVAQVPPSRYRPMISALYGLQYVLTPVPHSISVDEEDTMPLPAESQCQFTPDMRICRIVNGMWQVSGAHGRIQPAAAVQNMFDYVDAGFTTWDLADHYGPAEDFIGEFRRQLLATRGAAALANVQAFTKWVPRPGPMTRSIVEHNIALSLRRMDVDTLDLLQFHWWDYEDENYLTALSHLAQMRDAGQIRHLALTNFDTAHLQIITEHGIRVVSNQVQYSLIDLRPEVRMVPFCQEHNISLLTYGTLCGGLLSEAYVGQPEPRGAALNTASLRKYKQMIDAWGGWELFQELLGVLKHIADTYGVSIANVAVRAILDRPTVAGVIVGVRLGVTDHHTDNTRVFEFTLTPEDHQRIQAVLARSHDLYRLIGDCGDEYRR